MATAADKERLDTIRSRHDLASTDWKFVISGDRREQIVARLLPATPQVPIVDLLEDCGYQDRDFLLYAHSDIGFLLRLLADAFREIRSMRAAEQKKQKEGDFAAECAMKCSDPLFKRFLAEQHQVDIADQERIVSRVRTMLAIGSRSELNRDPQAAQRWFSLRAEFEAWRMMP